MRAFAINTFSWFAGKPVILLRKRNLVEGVGARLPVHTLTFANPGDAVLQGVRTAEGDVVKVCVPDYKPKSYTMSAHRPGEFDITIKVYPGGRASGFLDRLQLGEAVRVFRKGEKERTPGDLVGIVAYGIGITEALPMAAAELLKTDARRVVLLWASQSPDSTFWQSDIEQLQVTHGDRFAFSNIFSREFSEGSLRGRVRPAVLREVFGSGWGVQLGDLVEPGRSNVRLLAIGTKDMIKDTDAMFHELGFPMPLHSLLPKK